MYKTVAALTNNFWEVLHPDANALQRGPCGVLEDNFWRVACMVNDNNAFRFEINGALMFAWKGRSHNRREPPGCKVRKALYIFLAPF
jgi:hypothetical protein